MMRKKGLLYLVLILGVLCGGYTFSWYMGAHKVETLIAEQIKGLEGKGHRISYDSLTIKGFPFAVLIEIKNPHFETSSPIGITASVNGILEVCSYFWDPDFVNLFSKDMVEIKSVFFSKKDTLVLKAEKGLNAYLHFSNPLKGLKVSFQTVRFAGIKAQKVGIGLDINKEKQKKNTYQFKIEKLDSGSALFVGMPQVIDSVLVEVSVKGLIDSTESIEKSVKTWYKSDGVVDVDTFKIQWGDLTIKSNGTFSLDPNMQPLAAFSAEVYGLDTLLTKLGDAGFIHKNLLPIIRTSLYFLKESKGDQKKKSIYHKVAITLQDRELSIGSIPVAKLPAVNWALLGG